MNWEDIKHKFPACMHTLKMPDISKFKLEKIDVYRACINEKIDKNAFLPTYLDPSQKDYVRKNDPNLLLPGTYSLSVFSNKNQARRLMKILSDKKSKPYKLGKGVTNPKQGIWEKTCEWDLTHKKDSHYDYWLYEDNDVQNDFIEITID